jgi:large subunit ribosomal protein L25
MAASRNLVNRFRLRELKNSLPIAASTSSSMRAVKNPFIPHLNPETNCWAPPRYSLRRQAELIKKARLEGKLHLLPPGPKLTSMDILAAQPPKLEEQVSKEKGKERAMKIDVATPVEWLGEVKIREPIGANVGNRLYAGRKQMFKGHKWERVIRRRRKYQRILMRDMAERILRWRRVRGISWFRSFLVTLNACFRSIISRESHGLYLYRVSGHGRHRNYHSNNRVQSAIPDIHFTPPRFLPVR